MRRALVTGDKGFLGRHIARELRDTGWEVHGLDITGGTDAREWFRHVEASFGLVIHCAAAGANRQAADNTPLVLAANLELDAALFQWAARTRPGRVVYLSSSAAYPADLQGDGPARNLREDDISLGNLREPENIYGWVKLTGEKLAAFARAEGVPVTVVRPFAGYGEDQDRAFPFRAIADRARLCEDPLTVWGTGTQVRDWIHVDDVVAAILAIAREGCDGPVNLGTGTGTSMTGLAAMMARRSGYSPVIRPLPGIPEGVRRRVADSSLMRQFHVPKVSLEEGVARAFAVTAGKR